MSSSAQPQRLLPRSVRHVVAISSGKGGVGKSTTAVNIAAALANRLNLRVGLLDADVYGPSVPRLMNLSGLEPEVRAFAAPAAGDAGPGAGAGAAARREGAGEPPPAPSSLLSRLWGGGRGDGAAASTSAAAAGGAARGGGREVHKLMPLENHNVKCMSLGFMIADGAGAGSERAADRAVAWRGPMASSSLSRLVADTYWGDLDVLLVDMPPGTGDIHITYVHYTPRSCGAVPRARAGARCRCGGETHKCETTGGCRGGGAPPARSPR